MHISLNRRPRGASYLWGSVCLLSALAAVTLLSGRVRETGLGSGLSAASRLSVSLPTARIGGLSFAPKMVQRNVGVRGRLLIPGQDGVDDSGTFTPFMKPLTKDLAGKYGKPKKMLQELRFNAGPWQERAEMVDILLRSGIPPETITDEGGVSHMEQGNWRVALAVLRSLEDLGASAEIVDSFKNDESNADIMFGLRYVPKEVRVAAASYVLEKGFHEMKDVEDLSKNIVDYTRIKDEGKEGFEYTPADCYALRLYMKAAETMDEQTLETCIEQAKDSGCSASALQKIDELEGMSSEQRRKIIYRFTSDTEEFDKALTVDV